MRYDDQGMLPWQFRVNQQRIETTRGCRYPWNLDLAFNVALRACAKECRQQNQEAEVEQAWLTLHSRTLQRNNGYASSWRELLGLQRGGELEFTLICAVTGKVGSRPQVTDNATNSLLKKDLERAAVSTVRHCCSRKANKKRGSSSLRCSEWRAKTVFQQAANQELAPLPIDRRNCLL